MSGEEMTRKELMTLFEAAKWAPSSANNQPWRFIYSMKNSSSWRTFFSFLDKSNQEWCINASGLVVVVSKETFDYNGKFSRTHSFDAGAAWENLALQGSLKGLVVHGMQGFDYDNAKKELGIPDGYSVEAMIAVGKPGPVESLSKKNQKREFPSGRKQLNEIVFEGKFGGQ